MATIEQIIAAKRAERRAAGLNVRFVNGDGKPDEWSFATTARRDAFLAKLRADGNATAEVA